MTSLPTARRAVPTVRRAVPSTARRAGLALAVLTACVSGVSVFVNGYGVRSFPDATTYTTAKNLVAALALGALLVVATARGSAEGWSAPRGRRAWTSLVTVAIVGGSVPFVLFFEGLARATSTDAAFLHKTMVVWVAVLAVPLLRERLGVPHVASIGLLVAGQAVLAGDLTQLRPGSGEVLVLVATLLWSVEVIVAKRALAGVSPLTLASARMGGGVAVLVAWTALTGRLGVLAGLDAGAWGWALATGALLTAYVATWYGALARADAVDVTAVLVFAAVITAALNRVVDGVPLPDPFGLALVVAGVVTLVVATRRPVSHVAAA